MSSAGIDDRTGAVIQDMDHVRQSIGIILTTRIASRVMRRPFGSASVGLLGQAMEPSTVLKWHMAVVLALELWEPRFRVTSLAVPIDQNSASGLQQGQLSLRLTGEYRPNALSGDFSVAARPTISV